MVTNRTKRMNRSLSVHHASATYATVPTQQRIYRYQTRLVVVTGTDADVERLCCSERKKNLKSRSRGKKKGYKGNGERKPESRTSNQNKHSTVTVQLCASGSPCIS
jgi:hypothetical protein